MAVTIRNVSGRDLRAVVARVLLLGTVAAASIGCKRSAPVPPPVVCVSTQNNPCGQCGGVVLCNGDCSVVTPGDYGKVVVMKETSIGYTNHAIRPFGGPCDAGYEFAEATISGAQERCKIVKRGSGRSCEVTVNVNGLGLPFPPSDYCKLAIRQRRVCNG